MITTEKFEWKKERRTLVGSVLEVCGPTVPRFPETLTVQSHHTGRVMEFMYDNAAAERNEWWDGEMAEYRPVLECNVECLVLLNT